MLFVMVKNGIHFHLYFQIEGIDCCLSWIFLCSWVSEREFHTLSGVLGGFFVCFCCGFFLWWQSCF